MADNKLSWTDLRRALAHRAGVNEKEANAFLNALNTQLVDALKQDKQVKINGLGMFKLQAVAPRKSVNVTTGEQITIEGYNKIAFVPEAGVKELIESASTQTNDYMKKAKKEVDPIQKLGAQADEIKDILGDLGQNPEAPVAEAPAVEEPAPAVEAPAAEAPVAEAPVEEAAPAYVPEPAPVYIPEPAPADEPAPAPKKKESHFMRDTLICFIILILLALVGYFFLREQIGGWIDQLMLRIHPVEQVVPAEEPEAVVEEECELTEEMILAEFETASSSDDEWTENAKDRYPRLLATVPIHEGSRLTLIAKRHYGSKVYWPYLYDANKDRIPNPNVIKTGTPIRVPRLTRTQLDTTNAMTRANLERLRIEAEKAARE